jgi:hypothetical protein
VPREVPGLEKISDVSRAFIFLFQVSGVARLKKPVAFCIDLQNCAPARTEKDAVSLCSYWVA